MKPFSGTTVRPTGATRLGRQLRNLASGARRPKNERFIRLIDGCVRVGPNAVLAFRREGYRRTDFGLGAILGTLGYPGFWKLVRNHHREGLREMHRSLSKKAFVRSLRQMVPEAQNEDLVPARAGVRAQALRPDGRLVDRFSNRSRSQFSSCLQRAFAGCDRIVRDWKSHSGTKT
jgi:L-2-hydroxyglutarate oxidase LhgO